MKKSMISASCLVVAAVGGWAQGQCSTAKLTASDAASADSFGAAVDISGDFAIVGSQGDNHSGFTDAGSAYIYARNGAGWTQAQKLISPDPGTQEFFGASVTIEGDYAVVGCPSDTYFATNALGSVYVFHRVNGNWFLEANILSPDNVHRENFNRFGTNVALSGSTLAISALYENNSGGAVYVYTRSGTAWTLQQRIQPAGIGYPDFFGNSIALEGNELAIGATGVDSTAGFGTGAAYVYVRSGSVWSQQAKLIGSLTHSADQLGRAIAISGDRMTVSSLGGATGTVYAFKRTGLVWSQEAHMTPPNPAQSSHFGESMDMTASGGRLVIGRDAAGAGVGGRVGVYERVNNQWSLAHDLISPENSNSYDFAIGCAVDGDTVVVGDQGYDAAALANSGAAFVFEPYTAPGDLCSAALPVAAGTYFGSTTCAAANGNSTCSTSVFSRDVYYSYTAPCTQRVTIDTQGSTFDTILSIHTGCPASVANSIACNDDIVFTLNQASRVMLELSKNETVIIRVTGFNGLSGAYQLNIAESASVNDSCFSAEAVSDGAYPFGNCLGTTDGQTFTGACTIGQVSNDLWYQYTAGCNGQVSVDTCTGTDFDTALVVYRSSTCGLNISANIVACDDDACGLHSRVVFDATAGQVYTIRVGGFSSGQRGSGILTIASTANCPADHNLDGGIDGADVSSFFGDWESGAASADANCDGGIDGADVNTFFAAWENGGC